MAQKPRKTAPGHPQSPEDPYYVLAASPRADEHSRVLKQDDTFAVFDHYGDIRPGGLGEEGIYYEGTRYLSALLLSVGKERPLFLSSTVKEENDVLVVDLTNQDIADRGQVAVPRGTVHLVRVKFLWQAVCYEELRIRNYGLRPVHLALTLYFTADFADIFEVRGTRRRRRGQDLDAAIEDRAVTLAYRGLDGVVRRSRLLFDPAPARLSGDRAVFEMAPRPQEETMLRLTIACDREGAAPVVLPYEQALDTAATAQAARRWTSLHSDSNKQFNAWMDRTVSDLHMLITQTPAGPYPAAGVPWFSTPFGRDGILTALECLWVDPGLARGVLAYLAGMQATEVIPERDAEPGKILHETRGGEMAALGEIPFGRYYGSVDATPLFLFLAGAYYQRTGDRELIESLWPHFEAALTWIDTYGDADQDGFVEYARRSPTGLVQQGWKDSQDSVFHADGTLAEGPIALCEVQGYVYAARRAAAELAAVLGQAARAEEQLRRARLLQEKFEKAFWCEDLGSYALALDGAKRPCQVRTSNAGHCLLTGIANQEHALRTAYSLLARDSFSGWGVRTVAASEARYNPMSYHNGSVWPHDNALIAYGMARYGLQEGALQILTGLYEASLALDLHRLPELFCGFPRRPGEGPTLYPVACSPQAWSAASVFLLVQACLGLTISAPERQLCFSYPQLPEFLREVHVTNLRVGEAVLDLRLLRHGRDVGIHVLRREGDCEILMVR